MCHASAEPITEEQVAKIEKMVGKERARQIKQFTDGLSGHLAE